MSHRIHLPPEIDSAVCFSIQRHKRALRWGCFVAVVLASLLSLAEAWVLLRSTLHLNGWVASKISNIRIPLEWERPLGDAALAQIRGQYRFINDPQVVESLNRLSAPLFAGVTNSVNRFLLFVIESKEINAVALPGGYIVFHRGLLERAQTAEEIQGVLAHAMAHVLKRHQVLQLAKNRGLQLAIQQLPWGNDQLRDALIGDSGQLIGLKFGHDFEGAADDLGWELLQRAEIDPGGMLSFFAGLNAAIEAGTVRSIPLLSSHPAPRERIDRLRQKRSALSDREFRSFAGEFRALQTGLGIVLERP